jgi:2-oxoglutarate dehydrogenase E1 component
VVTSRVSTLTMWMCVCSRYGHNELDDPTITLPLSYQAVKDHPPVLQLYASKLDEQAVLKSSQVTALQVSS